MSGPTPGAGRDPSARGVAVVGSLNIDTAVPVARVPRAGETVLAGPAVQGIGGKGLNQAIGCARLGQPVTMIGCVGSDAAGDQLRAALTADGVDAGHVRSIANTSSGAAFILSANGESTIVVSPGANARLTPAHVAAAAGVIGAAAAVLCQLEVPSSVIERSLELARGLVVLNPAPAAALSPRVLDRVDVLVPNRFELAELTGTRPADSIDAAIEAATRLSAGRTSIVVTLGADGCVVVDGAQPVHVPARPAGLVDATAAGDSFCAALTDALLRGLSLADAAAWAVAAAAITVTRVGAATSLPTRNEICAGVIETPAATTEHRDGRTARAHL